MSGQPFHSQRPAYNKNNGNNNNSNSDFSESSTAATATNPRQSQTNTTRTTPDSGLGPDDQNKQDRSRTGPQGYNHRHFHERGAMRGGGGPPLQQPPQSGPGLHTQGVFYPQQPVVQNPIHYNESNSVPGYEAKQFENRHYANYDNSRNFNRYPPQSVDCNQQAIYDESNGNSGFVIQGPNETFERPPAQQFPPTGMIANGYEMDQSQQIYQPIPPQPQYGPLPLQQQQQPPPQYGTVGPVYNGQPITASPGYHHQGMLYRPAGPGGPPGQGGPIPSPQQLQQPPQTPQQAQQSPANMVLYNGGQQPPPPHQTLYRPPLQGGVMMNGSPQTAGQFPPYNQQYPQCYVNLPMAVLCKTSNTNSPPPSEKDRRVGSTSASGGGNTGRRNTHGSGSEQSIEKESETQILPSSDSQQPQIQQSQPPQNFVPNPFSNIINHQQHPQSMMGMPPPQYQQQYGPQQPVMQEQIMQLQHGRGFNHPPQSHPGVQQHQMNIPPPMNQHHQPMQNAAMIYNGPQPGMVNSSAMSYRRQAAPPAPLMGVPSNNMYQRGGHGGNTSGIFNTSTTHNSFNNGNSRGNHQRGRGGRGGWKNGNQTDTSYNHTRQNSGNSFDGRNHYGSQSYHRGGSHNGGNNGDEDVIMLTNRIEHLEPVNGSRTASPTKQMLQLIETKTEEIVVVDVVGDQNDETNETGAMESNVEVVETRQVIFEAAVAVPTAEVTAVAPVNEVLRESIADQVQASEEETEGKKPEEKELKCIKCESLVPRPENLEPHNLRRANGDAWCPFLQKEVCKNCGASGLKAHSHIVCPLKKQQEMENRNENDSRDSSTHREKSYMEESDELYRNQQHHHHHQQRRISEREGGDVKTRGGGFRGGNSLNRGGFSKGRGNRGGHRGNGNGGVRNFENRKN